MAGSPESFVAFRDLSDLLFRITVLDPTGGITLTAGPRPRAKVIGGWTGPEDPLPLNDGRYFRCSMTLFLDPTQQGTRLKVEKAAYQYQMDQEGNRWIFRYDYLRTAAEPHPGAHLQIRGYPIESCLPERTPLERIHFPTMRVSLEAVIRLLADGFGIRCNEPEEIWRPVLVETERLFFVIAHQPLAGP